MQPVIILFAKAPIPGRVKTRLQPLLSPLEAATLHEQFVRDMIERLQFVSHALIELHTDIRTDAWAGVNVTQRLQTEGGLQLKMLHALDQALLAGHSLAMILGSDAPTLPAPHIEWFLNCEADVALGPADDGGYYAVAARRTHPAMFDDISWSGPLALEQTVRAVRKCGLSVALGPPWFDVDEPRDLQRLAASAELPPRTAAWLKNWLAGKKAAY